MRVGEFNKSFHIQVKGLGMPQRKHMGCVTDREFHEALLEQYPNRKPGSNDSIMRKKVSSQRRDILMLSIEAQKTEARRYYQS